MHFFSLQLKLQSAAIYVCKRNWENDKTPEIIMQPYTNAQQSTTFKHTQTHT